MCSSTTSSRVSLAAHSSRRNGQEQPAAAWRPARRGTGVRSDRWRMVAMAHSRRQFLRVSVLGLGGVTIASLLAACGGAGPNAVPGNPTEPAKPAERKPAETKPAAPAAAAQPTTAPAAAAKPTEAAKPAD